MNPYPSIPERAPSPPRGVARRPDGHLLAAAAALALWSCGSHRSTGEEGGANEATATVTVRLSAGWAHLDVRSVRFSASCEGGLTLVREEPLLPEGLFDDPPTEGAPPDYEGEPLARWAFAAPPGTCAVGLRALNAGGEPAPECEEGWLSVAAAAGATARAEATLVCLVPQPLSEGPLDSLDWPPVVVGVSYDGGPALAPCEQGAAEVLAVDPEGGPLSVSWFVLEAPDGASYDVTYDGLAIALSAATSGEYRFEVVIVDAGGSATSAEVAFEVYGEPIGDCAPSTECWPGKCDDGDPCTADLCVDGVCSHETLAEVCDGADNDCNGVIDDDCFCERVGDVNGSGATNVADVQCALLTILWSLAGEVGPPPLCLAGGDPSQVDMNCDGVLDVADVQIIIYFALLSGPPPGLDLNGNGCVDACEPDPCGNSVCEPQESCESCAVDCGPCL